MYDIVHRVLSWGTSDDNGGLQAFFYLQPLPSDRSNALLLTESEQSGKTTSSRRLDTHLARVKWGAKSASFAISASRLSWASCQGVEGYRTESSAQLASRLAVQLAGRSAASWWLSLAWRVLSTASSQRVIFAVRSNQRRSLLDRQSPIYARAHPFGRSGNFW